MRAPVGGVSGTGIVKLKTQSFIAGPGDSIDTCLQSLFILASLCILLKRTGSMQDGVSSSMKTGAEADGEKLAEGEGEKGRIGMSKRIIPTEMEMQ